MAISTSLPIRLSTVITEIGLPAASSLQDCFDNATGTFNGTYAKTGEWLTEFRGYSHSCNTTTSLNIGGIPYGSNALACAGTYVEQARYFVGAGSDVANGDYVYTDSGGCTAYNGGTSYYKVRSNVSGFFTIRVSAAGLVSSKTAC